MTTVFAPSQISAFSNTFVGFGRNRIINGDMQIDQRNSGSSVSVSTSTVYTVDRMVAVANASPTGTWTVQQQTATPPNGFVTYIRATVGTAQASPSASQISALETLLEGNTTNDFQYGSAGALSAVLSFWVRSSLTGTFGGAVKNSNGGKSFPFNYTISSANTWTQITVNVPGDTSATLGSGTNASFAIVFICLMVGSTFQGTPTGAWQSGNTFGTTTGTNIMATSGATFDVTGLQFEIGTVATTFESSPYALQLFRCQRYYQIGRLNGSFPLTGNVSGDFAQSTVYFRTEMRVAPTVTFSATGGSQNQIPTTGTASVAATTLVVSSNAIQTSNFIWDGTITHQTTYNLVNIDSAWQALADY